MTAGITIVTKKNRFGKKENINPSVTGYRVIVKFAQYLLLITTDLIFRHYANITTICKEKLSNVSMTRLDLQKAFWEESTTSVVVTGTVANTGGFPSQKEFAIQILFF